MGSSSSAVVWTDPGCIGLQIAHGWRLAPTVVKRRAQERPSSQQQACQLGGARPGRITVPHWPEVRARSSGRAAPGARSACYSRRIGEEGQAELARGGLSGNPAPRERADRGWTPGVPARSAMQEGSGLLHPQVRQESGDRCSWSERLWSWR